jgi:lactate dehydrogenase-like 2-hydroxyacid dehydrogenase
MEAHPRILVTQKVPDPAYPPLAEIGTIDANEEEGLIWSPETLFLRAPGHDYLFCLVTNTIDARLLEACAASTPRLKLVANMAVGFNNIDLAAATRLGIAVTNTPGILSHHLIGTREFTLMKPGAILINTARGPVVDEKALVYALQHHLIAEAGLDVFENEPQIEQPLLSMENVVLLPHIASASLHTRTLMATTASANIVAHTRGQVPPNLLNPEVLM